MYRTAARPAKQERVRVVLQQYGAHGLVVHANEKFIGLMDIETERWSVQMACSWDLIQPVQAAVAEYLGKRRT